MVGDHRGTKKPDKTFCDLLAEKILQPKGRIIAARKSPLKSW
jgi:hypothetical protein